MRLSMVYSISKPNGEVVLYGWGPADAPLSPLIWINEGMQLVRAVATGELIMADMLRTKLPRIDAARIVRLLDKDAKCGGHGLEVAVVRDGQVQRYPSISAASRAVGMKRDNFSWHLHKVSATLAIFVCKKNRVQEHSD